ncbi:YaiI/YqxD family protein [Enterococcus sp. BWT-B8]|uniref:YaiI/YqxD family protein n=1 Tax=Enterococcus sp. BWT-B8 TaxID=2885157 RepID=UPI001E31190F|nr:YaiI/YqxD family protein [Enterococcus sp. BWT-B8]MCB5952121.1 YaiI/YqxD family protein [Enterococcus sp. BWT-B8]
MKIFIDGDGSPVKEDTISIGLSKELEIVVVTSIDHYSQKEYPKGVSFMYVDKGADSADYRILELIKRGDLLVTQDYGLASLALPKGAAVLHQLGKEYTLDSIDQLLEQRYFSAKVRKSGGRTKGPKPFTAQDREKFREKLREVIRRELDKQSKPI